VSGSLPLSGVKGKPHKTPRKSTVAVKLPGLTENLSKQPGNSHDRQSLYEKLFLGFFPGNFGLFSLLKLYFRQVSENSILEKFVIKVQT
jgi:hypothetical protein